MSNLINKAKNLLLGLEYDENDEEVVLEEEIMEEENEEQSKKKRFQYSTTNSKVVNIHPSVKMEVIRTYPEVVADAFLICDYIRENKVCIVNLEGVDFKESQRIADFLGGAAYALNGDIQRISKGVFIVAPTTVEITGQLKEELKENGVIFPWLSNNNK